MIKVAWMDYKVVFVPRAGGEYDPEFCLFWRLEGEFTFFVGFSFEKFGSGLIEYLDQGILRSLIAAVISFHKDRITFDPGKDVHLMGQDAGRVQ